MRVLLREFFELYERILRSTKKWKFWLVSSDKHLTNGVKVSKGRFDPSQTTCVKPRPYAPNSFPFKAALYPPLISPDLVQVLWYIMTFSPA